jgi:hypothetical protein
MALGFNHGPGLQRAIADEMFHLQGGNKQQDMI